MESQSSIRTMSIDLDSLMTQNLKALLTRIVACNELPPDLWCDLINELRNLPEFSDCTFTAPNSQGHEVQTKDKNPNQQALSPGC